MINYTWTRIFHTCMIDNQYTYNDKPHMNEDIPYMYDIIQICMNDKPDMYDDMPDLYKDTPDMYDDMTYMYEYHIHAWYHIIGGDGFLLQCN